MIIAGQKKEAKYWGKFIVKKVAHCTVVFEIQD